MTNDRTNITKKDVELYSEQAGLSNVRFIFLMAAFDHPYRWIAEEFNIPIGTVKSRISRSREAIKKVKHDPRL